MNNLIIEKLKNSKYISSKTTENTERFSDLICPRCNQPEAYLYKNNPNYIYCNRQNKCGAKTSTIELFSIYDMIEKNFPPTTSDPNRPAREYLKSRGIKNILPNVKYEYVPNIRKIGGGVMFPIGNDEFDKEIKSGRLFNPPKGEGKTHHTGPTKGRYFSYSTEFKESEPLYITEGIINALSLNEIGLQAIAILSCCADISQITLPPHSQLIFAFDNDEAGIKGMQRNLRIYDKAKCILPPRGKDWNDFLVSIGNSEKAKEKFEKNYQKWKFNADLALAKNKQEYVEIYWNYHGFVPELFDFMGCYYAGKLTRDDKPYAEKVSNFTVDVDHYQKCEDSKNIGHVYYYSLNIYPVTGGTRVALLDGSELSSAEQLRKALISKGKVYWEGDKAATMALGRLIVNANSSPIVRKLNVVGYDEQTKGYYFSDFAINAEGKKISLDTKGFINISSNECIMPFQYSTIKPSEFQVDLQHIYRLIYNSWGNQGATAIAFIVASWFVNLVKPVTGFFPFLSLFGDTQTGKSRLTRVLNYIQAIDEEGMPIFDTNTKKGGLRKIAQFSGLVKALIEGNSQDNKSFDYSLLLPLYNKGNKLQTTAIKSLDTRTHEIPFLGSLMFVQNTEPFKTKAEKERVISIQFFSHMVTEETQIAFDELMRFAPQDLATFIVNILKQRRHVEKNWGSLFEKNKKVLSEIGDFRIAENHALILTFHQLLCEILELEHDLQPYIIEIANAKKESCSKNNNPVIDLFFNQLDEVDEEISSKFYEINLERKLLYLNLHEAIRTLENLGYRQPSLGQLVTALKDYNAFKDMGFKYRFKAEIEKAKDNRQKQRRVWVFDIMKMQQ